MYDEYANDNQKFFEEKTFSVVKINIYFSLLIYEYTTMTHDKTFLANLINVILSFKQKIKNISYKSPILWGACYFGSIPLFSLYYYLFSENLNLSTNQSFSFWDAIYFSIITLTTLGYGDIAPDSECGRMVVMSEALLGVIFIGLFLNAISHRQAKLASDVEKKKIEAENLKNEKKKLLRYYNLLRLTEHNFKTYIYRVTTPMEKRGEKIEPNEGFAFNDLKDIYTPSLLLSDDFRKPVISYYYETLDEYTEILKKILLETDIKLFPKIEEQITGFITLNKAFDFRQSILSAEKMETNDKKKLSSLYSDMIAKYKGEIKMISSSSYNQFFALYQSIEFNLTFFKQLKREVDNNTTDL